MPINSIQPSAVLTPPVHSAADILDFVDEPIEEPQEPIVNGSSQIKKGPGKGNRNPRVRHLRDEKNDWPRLVALNLQTKDIYEMHRGPITREQMTEICEGFSPKFWQMQLWNGMHTRLKTGDSDDTDSDPVEVEESDVG